MTEEPNRLMKLAEKLENATIKVTDTMRFPVGWRYVECQEIISELKALASSEDSLSRLEEKVQAKYKESSLLQMPMVDLDKTSLDYGFTDGLRWVRAEIQALKAVVEKP